MNSIQEKIRELDRFERQSLHFSLVYQQLPLTHKQVRLLFQWINILGNRKTIWYPLSIINSKL